MNPHHSGYLYPNQGAGNSTPTVPGSNAFNPNVQQQYQPSPTGSQQVYSALPSSSSYTNYTQSCQMPNAGWYQTLPVSGQPSYAVPHQMNTTLWQHPGALLQMKTLPGASTQVQQLPRPAPQNSAYNPPPSYNSIPHSNTALSTHPTRLNNSSPQQQQQQTYSPQPNPLQALHASYQQIISQKNLGQISYSQYQSNSIQQIPATPISAGRAYFTKYNNKHISNQIQPDFNQAQSNFNQAQPNFNQGNKSNIHARHFIRPTSTGKKPNKSLENYGPQAQTQLNYQTKQYIKPITKKPSKAVAKSLEKYGPQQQSQVETYGNATIPTNDTILFCEPCDKEFKQYAAYEAHCNNHEPCSYPGCKFSATKKSLNAHFSLCHGVYNGTGYKMIEVEGSKFKVLLGTDPKEVNEWRESRKKRFPTKDNIKKKVEHKQLVENSGGLLGKNKKKTGKKRGREDLNNNPIDEEEQLKRIKMMNEAKSVVFKGIKVENLTEVKKEPTALTNDIGESKEQTEKNNNSNEKKHRCRRYSRGKCQSGDDCKYSHDFTPIICKYYPQGKCRKGNSCLYVHDRAIAKKIRQERKAAGIEPNNNNSNSNSNKGVRIPPPLDGGVRGTLLQNLLRGEIQAEESIVLQGLRFLVRNNFMDEVEEEVEMLEAAEETSDDDDDDAEDNEISKVEKENIKLCQGSQSEKITQFDGFIKDCLSMEDVEKRDMKMRQLSILRKILSDEKSEPYWLPVDLELVPSYSDFVDNPMDLQTITQRVLSGDYNDQLQPFLDDVRLVWSNNKLWNLDTPITAKLLSETFEGLVENWVLSDSKPENPDIPFEWSKVKTEENL